MVDPRHVGLRRRIVLGIRDEGQGVNHGIGIEFLAIMKFDALAQVEFERTVVDLPEALGKLALVLTGNRIPVKQRIPNIGAQDHADAHIVEVWINVFGGLVVGHAQRIRLFVGQGRPRKPEHRCNRNGPDSCHQPGPEGCV